MFGSFASADLFEGQNVVLLSGYGFNFSTNTSSSSLVGMDFLYNGSAAPTGPPNNPGANAYRVWVVDNVAQDISPLGPNLDFANFFKTMPQSAFFDESGKGNFPVYAAEDGITFYTGSNYAIIKIVSFSSTQLVFSYKYNNQSDNTTVGVSPSGGCWIEEDKDSCFAAGATCNWDEFGGFCRDSSVEGSDDEHAGVGGDLHIIDCAAFNNKLFECAQINQSLCYSDGSSCVQNNSFDNSVGIKCRDVVVQGMCDNVPVLNSCCSWDGSNCKANSTKTTCVTNFSSGISSGGKSLKFCEDARNDSAACTALINNYFPCTFDNTSSAERIKFPKCVFSFSGAFGSSGASHGGGFGGGGLTDISTQASCQAAGGNWKTFTYENIDTTYGTKTTVTETHCEANFGSLGGGSGAGCDSLCDACNNLVTSAQNDSTEASNACTTSKLGVCKWKNNTNAPNGLGFCKFDKSITDFGGGGNCQNDCFACYDSGTCGSSAGNCSWTADPFGQDFNGDGTVDGWCDPQAYASFNSCASSCNACYTETACNQSAVNSGVANCTWIDSFAPKATHPYYNVSNAGVSVDYGYVGCVKVTQVNNRSQELCTYPGDEDGDGQSDCQDSECQSDPSCGFGLGGGLGPVAEGQGAGGGGEGGAPFGANTLGFGSDCFSRDNTNQSHCTNLTGCIWKSIGGGAFGLCDPSFNQQMQGGMSFEAPPTIVGQDASGDAGGQDHLDIRDVGFHESPDKLNLGMAFTNLTNFVACSKFYPTTSQNLTGKYYRFIDADGNASTGCNTSSVGGVTDQSGFEYKIVHEDNDTTEAKLLFRCGLSSTQFLNNASRWQLVSKAQVSYISDMCFVDDFMAAEGIGGVHLMVLSKTDLGNPKNAIRFYMATANATHNDSLPVDTAGPFFYTPGSIDFKMEDCSATGVDLDGDGYNAEQDPDCSAFKQYGFVPMESGPQCNDGVDNDGNDLTDCNDYACKYDSFVCPSAGYKKDPNDNTAPKVTLQQMSIFPDGAIVKASTNKPTNMSVEFYGTTSGCTTLNQTVLDASLVLNSDIFDDYKPFHDMHLETYGPTGAALTKSLSANTTYFFKTRTCDLSDNCARSACQNFTTKASSSASDCSTCSFIVSFDKFAPPAGFANDHPLSNLTFQLDFGGDGSFDFNNTGGGSGKKTNYSSTLNTTIVFKNPQSAEPWQITLKGLDIASSLSSVVSNLSTAFLFNTSDDGEVSMGMNGDQFDAFNQNYGVDVVEIKMPVVGDRLLHCDETNTSNCKDVTGNATKIAEDAESSTWQFAVSNSLQFSLYEVQGQVGFRSDKSSYQCHTDAECVMHVNITNDNSSTKDIRYNVSMRVATTDHLVPAEGSFGISTWNGSQYNYNGTVDANGTDNLTIADVNLTASPFKLKLNMTLPINFTAGGRFRFMFNATDYALPNSSEASFAANVSFGGLYPYIDIINLTGPPANAATVGATTTSFTYTLFTDFNGNSSLYNQSCVLYINGTKANNSAASLNASAVTLSSNFTLEDATYAWNVSCTNNETETGYSLTRTFTSGAAPTVNISSPTTSTRTNDNSTLIEFTLNDSSEILVNSFLIYFNHTNSTFNHTYNLSLEGTCSSGSVTSKNCSLEVNASQLLDGVWKVNVSGNDAAGNYVNRSTTFIVDVTVPNVTGLNFSDNYVANSTSITFTVNVSDTTTHAYNVTAEFGTTRVVLNKSTHPFWTGTMVLTGDENSNTMTVRSFDNATNVATGTATYYIDSINPVVVMSSPSTNGTTITNSNGNATVSYNVTSVNVSTSNLTIYNANGVQIRSTSTSDSNGTITVITQGLKPGLYYASAAASDSAGNGAKLPYTALSFNINSQQNTTQLEQELNDSLGEGAKVVVLNGTSGAQINGVEFLNTTLIKQVSPNSTRTGGTAVVVNVTAYGSNFNQNKTDALDLEVDTTSADGALTSKVTGGALDTLILFKNWSQYIGDNNYTNETGAKQWVEISLAKALDNLIPFFISDDAGKDLVVMSACATAVPSTTPNRTNACYTNGSTSYFYVPHLSGVGVMNSLDAVPVINLTNPMEMDAANPGLDNSYLTLTGVVNSADLNTSACNYTVYNNTGTNLTTPQSFIPSQVSQNSTNYTFDLNGHDVIGNFTNGTIYNVSVQCTSNSGNASVKELGFLVNDSTQPKVIGLASASSGTSTVTLTWTLTTDENATCYYGTSKGNISILTKMSSTVGRTHTQSADYTSDTSGTYYFACNDTLGNGGSGANYTNSSAFSVDQTADATTTTASGSSGGGSSTTVSSTAKGISTAKKWITPLNPGVTANMQVRSEGIPVSLVSFTLANRVTNVQLTVTKLDAAPETPVPEGAGKVHSYIDVATQNLEAKDLTEVKFKFAVKKTWLTENGYSVENVLMQRFDGIKWVDLPTKQLQDVNGDVVYEATSPGFSVFAIVGRTAVEGSVAEEEAQKAEDAAKEPVVEEDEQQPEADAPVIPTQPKKPFTGWLVVLLIVVIGVAGYFFWQKKKGL
jgi:PGF-pre-PGF domain-containing protein